MYDDSLGVSRLEITTIQDDLVGLLNSIRLSAGLNELSFEVLRGQAHNYTDALIRTMQVGLYAEEHADDMSLLSQQASKWFDDDSID